MKGKNEMTASFPSLSQNEALARSVVAGTPPSCACEARGIVSSPAARMKK